MTVQDAIKMLDRGHIRYVYAQIGSSSLQVTVNHAEAKSLFSDAGELLRLSCTVSPESFFDLWITAKID